MWLHPSSLMDLIQVDSGYYCCLYQFRVMAPLLNRGLPHQHYNPELRLRRHARTTFFAEGGQNIN